MTFTVDPGVAMPRPPDPDALVFTLRKFGFLRVTVGTTQNPNLLVQGAIVTITLQDGTTQQREAHPGDTHVDFGDLPTDDYTVEVRAPGHQRVTTSVQLEAGDGPDDDKLVTVRRLGLVQGTVKSVLTTGLEQDLPGAQIAVRQGVAGTPFVGTTGSTGTYRVTGTTVTDGLVRGDDWQVEATAPGHDAVPATPVEVPDPLTAPLGSLDVDVPPDPAAGEERGPPGPRVRRHHGGAGSDHAAQLPGLHRSAHHHAHVRPGQQHRTVPRRAVRVLRRAAADVQPEHLRPDATRRSRCP